CLTEGRARRIPSAGARPPRRRPGLREVVQRPGRRSCRTWDAVPKQGKGTAHSQAGFRPALAGTARSPTGAPAWARWSSFARAGRLANRLARGADARTSTGWVSMFWRPKQRRLGGNLAEI